MSDTLKSTLRLTTRQICDLLESASNFEIHAESNQVYHGTLGSQRVDQTDGRLYVDLYGVEYCIADGDTTYVANTYVNSVVSVMLKQSELIIV